MDVYHKLTDSFNFLNYSSCHPSHTKNNIALALGRRIINIVTRDSGPKLDELKNHLLQRNHPTSSINYAFSKLYQPKNETQKTDGIVLTTTYSPRISFDRKVVSDLFRNIRGGAMQKAFGDCKIIMGTRQPKASRNFLIRSKFSSHPRKNIQKTIGLFNCKRNCTYHINGYIRECTEFRFGKNNRFYWKYSRYFHCDVTNIIYILNCNNCWEFYIGETVNLKTRVSKHKSDVTHPENSYCKKLMSHLRTCSNFREPYFRIYPIYFVENQQRRRFMEKRFIHYFRPPLNSDS